MPLHLSGAPEDQTLPGKITQLCKEMPTRFQHHLGSAECLLTSPAAWRLRKVKDGQRIYTYAASLLHCRVIRTYSHLISFLGCCRRLTTLFDSSCGVKGTTGRMLLCVHSMALDVAYQLPWRTLQLITERGCS